MKLLKISLVMILIPLFFSIDSEAQTIQSKREDIYHRGWIDLNKNHKMDPYENQKLDIKERIEDLIARMSMEEKTCQMATLYGYGKVAKDQLPTKEWFNKIWKDGIANIDQHLEGSPQTEYSRPPSKHAQALNEVQKFFIEKTRLGIPVDFTQEGIHGVHHDNATCFPAPIGMASMWDEKLVEEIGHITGKEAKALGYTNIYAPICDLARDPRWGRVVENYGEDPYLASRLAVAMVKGIQAEGVVSTLKHFCVYGIPKGGRDGPCRTDPKAPLRDVENIYLAPFRAAIVESGALGVMASYNDYDGIPITGSKEFLTKKLCGEWGFKGYKVSDSDAVKFIFSKHHVAPTYKEAVRQSVEAGLNVRTTFNPPEVFINPLRELVKEGKLSMKTIDERVRSVLRVKFLLGLFDHPYVEEPLLSDKIVHSKKHQELALKASQESIVLLKNEGGLLPLDKDIKSILVTGPNANESRDVLGTYGPINVKMITVLEGIKNKVSSKTEVKYVKGCNLVDKEWPESEILPNPPSETEKPRIEEAKSIAKTVDMVIVVLGGSNRTCGESRSRTSLDLPGFQPDLVKAIYETGTPTVVVLLNGRALTINWINKYIPAIIEAWYPGEKGGQAIADVLFGDYNPGGKLSVTFPKTVGQIPMNFPHNPGTRGKGRCRVSGVLYPFGYGLSYTDFEYSNLKITPEESADGNVSVSVDVKNVGDMKGDEVVQLYINDVVSSVITPVEELKGFRRITLKPGEKKRVSFSLVADQLSLLNRNMERVVEPGVFKVMIGSSSDDIRLKGEFEVFSGD
ncbi:MAG: glycoside hydrolase family 3 N-terminal domain-containing protein [candidate division WOR-3 bacterium]|nr:glycoside hydrolase family 3 N-terminal domain-containing protein [candidate division WOR-3 bacterium]